MKVQVLTICILCSVGWSFAQKGDFNNTRMLYGEEALSPSARTLSLGNSGLADQEGITGLFLNPANLATARKSISVSAGFMMDKVEEDRSFPYYDTFGGFTDYGSYFYNKNWYPYFYGQANMAIPQNILPGLRAGVGFYPFYDFYYDYLEAVGQPNKVPDNRKDKLLGYNTITSSGRLNAIPVTLAAPVIKNLSLGVQLSILQGSIDKRRAMEPFEENVTPEEADIIRRSYKINNELNNTPVITSLGARYQINERLSVAALYRASYQISFDRRAESMGIDSLTLNPTQKLDYPARVGAGLSYQFENVLAARINLDFLYDFWEDFSDDLNPELQFDNTYTIRAGIEHIFLSLVPIRAGFSYQTLREDKDFSRTLITAGTGLVFRGWRVDLGGGVSFMEYHQPDLFDDDIYGLVSRRNDLDRVRLSNFYGRVDVNYEF